MIEEKRGEQKQNAAMNERDEQGCKQSRKQGCEQSCEQQSHQAQEQADAQRAEAELADALRGARARYEAIPIPEDAKKRVKAGVRQAEVLPLKRYLKRYLKRAGLTAAAAVLLVIGLANVNPVVSNAMGRLPVIGPLAQIVTFRSFVQEDGGFEANVSVPAVSAAAGESLAANEQIQQYAETLIQQYETELGAAQGEGHYSLTSSYDVVFENSRYVCIRIDTTVTMASGAQFVKVFTVDKATGQTVSLRALLGNDEAKLAAVSENIKTQMREQMAADANKQYFIDTDMPEDDFKDLSGEESYYFDEAGRLVISFDEYSVAPGYMGAVSFTIPKELTGDLAG